MTHKVIAFTVITDEQGVRVRCCFCGEPLVSKQGSFDVRDLAELSEHLLSHPCFQPGADNTFRALRHGLTH